VRSYVLTANGSNFSGQALATLIPEDLKPQGYIALSSGYMAT
jgi:hypothetical protein